LGYDRLITEAALWKADAALGSRRLNEAEVSIRTAIEHTPTRLDGHVMLARLHVERREYNEALLVLDKTRGLGFSEEIYNLKSTALEALGQRTAAIDTLNELVRLRPDLQWARKRLSALSTEADHQEIKQ
jgi:predicted negative regulator of RcsB-dependent stress response